MSFQLAHAQARDAVHGELDVQAIEQQLELVALPSIALSSAAQNRDAYLQRPDFGRRLSAASVRRLTELADTLPETVDAVFIIADGLSAAAVQRHAVPTLAAVQEALQSEHWHLAPVVIVRQGRVAISDEIGALLRAEQAVILLGERPGLSAPDSLGIYLTYGPRPGKTDAQRNCISNVRAAGLSYEQAAGTLTYLMRAARRRQTSGVMLKDDRPLTSELAHGALGVDG